MVLLLAFSTALAREPSERMPGYLVSPPPGQLLAHAVNNGDGTVTIAAGMHSAAANAWHRKACQSFGATDISDDGPITFSADSPDAAACLGPPGRPPSTRAVALGTDREGRLYLAATALLPPSGAPGAPPGDASPPTLPALIVPHSSTGSVPVGSYYTAPAYAESFQLPSLMQGGVTSTIHEPVPCRWTKTALLGPGQALISGYVVCHAQGANAVSDLLACWNTQCQGDRQMIWHY